MYQIENMYIVYCQLIVLSPLKHLLTTRPPDHLNILQFVYASNNVYQSTFIYVLHTENS